MAKRDQFARTTFTFRIDPELKQEFMAATETENKPVSQVLRDLMAEYVERKKQKRFEAEVMDWISDVTDSEGWK